MCFIDHYICFIVFSLEYNMWKIFTDLGEKVEEDSFDWKKHHI